MAAGAQQNIVLHAWVESKIARAGNGGVRLPNMKEDFDDIGDSLAED